MNNQQNNITIDQEIIFEACRSIVSQGQKLTGAKVRKYLTFRYGFACDNSFLYKCLKKYKKSCLLNDKDFDTDKLENEILKFPIPDNLPDSLVSLSMKSFFYSLSHLSDYILQFESTSFAKELSDELDLAKAKINYLKRQNTALKGILEYIREHQLINVESSYLSRIDEMTFAVDSIEETNEPLIPYCIKDGHALTLPEFSSIFSKSFYSTSLRSIYIF